MFLSVQARVELFAEAGLPPAVLDALLEQQFRLQVGGYSAQLPDATSLLIEWIGQPVGRLLLHCHAPHWRILDIALLPSWRGRGIGTSVISAVTAIARQQGAQALKLAMLVTNNAARRLYQRLGFADTDPSTGTTHVEMRKDLAG